MQIEYITSNNMWKLLYETIRLMDKATAHHGMRVSYIMSKMLENVKYLEEALDRSFK